MISIGVILNIGTIVINIKKGTFNRIQTVYCGLQFQNIYNYLSNVCIFFCFQTCSNSTVSIVNLWKSLLCKNKTNFNQNFGNCLLNVNVYKMFAPFFGFKHVVTPQFLLLICAYHLFAKQNKFQHKFWKLFVNVIVY